MKKITEVAHECLNNYQVNIAVDFTCGHGFDTKFLSSIANKVYAFDIQNQAIEEVEALKLNNVEAILDTHLSFDQYLETFDIGIFNLGYLPNGDKKIYTDGDVVVKTLEKACKLMNRKGRLVIACYPGFPAGEKEAKIVEKYVSELASKHFDVTKLQLLNRNHAPYLLIIDKH